MTHDTGHAARPCLAECPEIKPLCASSDFEPFHPAAGAADSWATALKYTSDGRTIV